MQQSTQRITLGEVGMSRVIERQAGFGAPGDLLPTGPRELWQENRDWLAPDFWRPEQDVWVGAVQTWVLRSEGRTILVDTGVGNGRHRPSAPHFENWDTDFLDRLALAGVRPEEVDVVVNTHLHTDHVGWNTVEQDGRWVPAFPNARYLFPAADFAHLDPARQHERPAPHGERERLRRANEAQLFADSIAPVYEAGLAELWTDGYRIDGNLTLEPAPGHTPGSSVLRLASGGDRAVFVGDLVHSPVQILAPEHSSGFCLEPEQSAVTRRQVLSRAADQRELVIPAHFGGSGICEVQREGSGFGIASWR
ncbi:MBL fold metallo-hydrolase [Kitasatospora sp. NPDC008050]|uniref:MBL fold metallo-hydrolase n=1 Tax=Kitasatospora sp. NPDC008050 TaxID=3364021 RepID=UPI0036ECC54B